MADNAVTFLLENLPRLLLQEVNLPYEVGEQIKSLHDQLRILNAFLEVSEGKRNEHAVIREIISQIRDTVHEAEDVIDTYIYSVNRQRIKNWWDLANHVNHSKVLRDVAFKIDKIKLRIEETKKNQQEYYGVEFGQLELNDHDDAAAANLINKRRRAVEEDDVVGFDEDSLEVINKLTESEGHQRRRREIISIIGMGGLGKTTLARKIYRNNRVKRHFNCCAWTDVSTDYEPKQLLLNLLEQLLAPKFHVSAQEMSMEDLRNELHNSLRGSKRYLVVLDDIWEPKAWEDIKEAFPDNQNGSRILITTRSNEVANHLSVSCVYNQYHLPFLSKEKSWELFSKRVFHQGEEEFPHDLEDLGKKMAESCGGLPLSIVVLAGLMTKMERSKARWSLVAGNENWHLLQQRTSCSEILALSYYYLPRQLKPCFLYVGLYPEDSEIPVKQLIRLWVAEGFIPQDTGTKQKEDVAELYLQELIDRSLIQIASRRTDGGVKTCRIHDLLRVLCIEESKKDKFYQVYTGNNNSSTSTLAKPRRLSLYCSPSRYLSSSFNTDHSSVRSLICVAQDPLPEHVVDSYRSYMIWRISNRRYWKLLIRNFKLVRVLDFSRAGIMATVPGDIRKLIHLRYLAIDIYEPLSGSDFGSIVAHVCELRNLETLELRGYSEECCLPTKISNLKQLRHLLMFGTVKMPRSLNEPLENLLTLSNVALEDQTGILLSKFPKLRKLGLYYKSSLKFTPRRFWPTLRNLCDLQTLKIIFRPSLRWADMLPQNAESFPLRLTKMTLAYLEGLNCDIMKLLGSMPNLEILKLLGSSRIKRAFDIDSESGWFQRLMVFQMRGLHCKNWKLVTGAMPRLQNLVIHNCKTLKMVPEELWSLGDLRQVQVSWPSKELADTLGKLKMKDGCRLSILNIDLSSEI